MIRNGSRTAAWVGWLLSLGLAFSVLGPVNEVPSISDLNDYNSAINEVFSEIIGKE